MIVGGESGPGARPMHPDWARRVKKSAVEANVPFFFKQWGEWAPYDGQLSTLDYERAAAHHFPDATLYRIGKKRANRLLDGREWNEFPAARA